MLNFLALCIIVTMILFIFLWLQVFRVRVKLIRTLEKKFPKEIELMFGPSKKWWQRINRDTQIKNSFNLGGSSIKSLVIQDSDLQKLHEKECRLFRYSLLSICVILALFLLTFFTILTKN